MRLKFISLIFFGLTLHGFSQSHIEYSNLLDSAKKYSTIDSSSAFGYLEEALKLAELEKSESQIIEIEFLRAQIYFQHSAVTKSKTTLIAALPRAEALNNKALIAQGNMQLGMTNKLMGKSAKAIIFFQKAAYYADNTGNSDLKARALSQTGSVYKNTSSLDSAMVYSMEALKLFESLSDTANIFETLTQIGNINVLAKNYDEAYATFSSIEPLAYASNDSSQIVDVFLHKGLVQQKNQQYEEAIENYKRGLEYSPTKGNEATISILNGNIGSTLSELGKYKESLPYLLKALELKKASNASAGSLCHTYLDLSKLYIKLQDLAVARDYAEKVIDLTKNSNDDYYRHYGYLRLAEVQHAMGNDSEAYQNVLKYSNLKDSIYDVVKARQVQELQVAYEAEKKDAEIRMLDQERTIERTQKRMYLLAVFVALALGFVIYWFQRAKSKKNIQLLEKEKEIDALKTNFFANISHEFRTPLTLILGPIQSKLETVTDEVERDELLMMERNAIRLHRLINDILDLAKSEEGKLELRNQPLNLSMIVKGLASSFQSLADLRAIEFDVIIDENILKDIVLADQSKLETVLINLVSNAFKFTPNGGSVTIKLTRTNTIYSLTVKDSGAGIPANKLSRIFDRFYQVDDSSTRKNEGTGIGLAFSKEIVTLMGGEISAESSFGNGSTFKVKLPFERTNQISNLPNNPSESSSKIQLQDAILSLSPSKEETSNTSELPILLLVEDNPDVRTYISSILKEYYQITFAENGKIGLDRAIEIVPDIIISDVMMPVMDGFELCKTIKNDFRTSHIPFVMLTAKSSAESRIEGLETEADVYMSKPFNPTELKLQIRNLLALHQNIQEKFKSSNTLVPESVNLNSAEHKFLKKLGEIMEAQYINSDFSVQQFSDEMGMSRSQLHRKLIAATGESPSKFIRTYRLKIAEKMLQSKTGAISEIAYDVGFNSVPYFNRCFLEKFGKRPSEV